MKLDSLVVVDERVLSNPVDCGGEYLCLRRISESKYELSLREYEILGDIRDYCDDNGEENIPDFIDGKKVIHGEGYDLVLGGDLVIQKLHIVPITFFEPNFNDISIFLNEFDWNSHQDSKPSTEVYDEIKRLVSKSDKEFDM